MNKGVYVVLGQPFFDFIELPDSVCLNVRSWIPVHCVVKRLGCTAQTRDFFPLEIVVCSPDTVPDAILRNVLDVVGSSAEWER